MTIAKLVFTSLLLMAMSGCGGSDYHGTSETELNVGDIMEVNQGDELIQTSSDTEIEITHILDDEKRYVKILSGSATLIKNN